MPEKKILVIDGETAILSLMNDVFKTQGYAVVTAESGEMACHILSEETFSVILLDLKLPCMSGMELCRWIRTRDKEVVIYAFTSHMDFGNQTDCRSAGFDGVFLKPISLDVLLEAVEGGLERASSGKRRESNLCDILGTANCGKWRSEVG